MAKTYNGHKNYNYWNVSLWLSNDEGLYRMVCDAVRRNRTKDAAAREVLDSLTECGLTKTSDGAPFTLSAIRAALSGWE
jgi:hypothetical protein